ncbi:MAG: bifunctional hydroxymethylpyrimidine kinase/phosphomethylpyrimidine kinase [Actinobacteria bacterium]|nr:bifunctional hydroxymethylpyrimidine kinase/phosphomethylpyrimidine kinase [Actinomycetota bacterium]
MLTIAGSDSGGGAGVQADLKTFLALRAHGMTAITAVTAQNTTDVESVYALPADVVGAQIDAVAGDIGVDAVKTGMMPTAEIVIAVAERIEALACPAVVDPVLRSSSGVTLTPPSARDALVERLLPLATVCTPNLAEARILAADATLDAPAAAVALRDLGAGAAIVTGGAEGAPDWCCDERGHLEPVGGDTVISGADHGTGCTHAAALAVALARGESVVRAARFARGVTAAALAAGAEQIGAGHGPLGHHTLIGEDAGIATGAGRAAG